MMDHDTAKPGERASTPEGWETADLTSTDTGEKKDSPAGIRYGVVFPRLLIGLIVLICAEVFSGASLGIGLWNPWTLIVTYWLYFAHFFFFTTLAIRHGPDLVLGALSLGHPLRALRIVDHQGHLVRLRWRWQVRHGADRPLRTLRDQHGLHLSPGHVVHPAACGRVRALPAAAPVLPRSGLVDRP